MTPAPSDVDTALIEPHLVDRDRLIDQYRVGSRDLVLERTAPTGVAVLSLPGPDALLEPVALIRYDPGTGRITGHEWCHDGERLTPEPLAHWVEQAGPSLARYTSGLAAIAPYEHRDLASTPEAIDPADTDWPVPRYGPPAVRVSVIVRLRRAVAWFGLAVFTTMAAVLTATGVGLGFDWRTTAAIAGHSCIAAAYAWYLHHPIGLYDPASATYVHVWPFGLARQRVPSRRSRGHLIVRGDRIVNSRRPWQTIASRHWLRTGDWQSIADAIEANTDRPATPESECTHER